MKRNNHTNDDTSASMNHKKKPRMNRGEGDGPSSSFVSTTIPEERSQSTNQPNLERSSHANLMRICQNNLILPLSLQNMQSTTSSSSASSSVDDLIAMNQYRNQLRMQQLMNSNTRPSSRESSYASQQPGISSPSQQQQQQLMLQRLTGGNPISSSLSRQGPMNSLAYLQLLRQNIAQEQNDQAMISATIRAMTAQQGQNTSSLLHRLHNDLQLANAVQQQQRLGISSNDYYPSDATDILSQQRLSSIVAGATGANLSYPVRTTSELLFNYPSILGPNQRVSSSNDGVLTTGIPPTTSMTTQQRGSNQGDVLSSSGGDRHRHHHQERTNSNDRNDTVTVGRPYNSQGIPIQQYQNNMDLRHVPMFLPICLSRPADEYQLSDHQQLLRRQIEAFSATENDVTTHIRGRNKPITIGQVGIRCRHCAHVPVLRRQKGSTYFPSCISGIYQAAQNMSTAHIQNGLCHAMPESIKLQFQYILEMKQTCSSTGSGRPYWAKSAIQIGLIDTPENGIRFIRDIPTIMTTTSTTTNTASPSR